MFLIRRTLPLLALAFASSLCAAAKPGEAEALRCFELRDSEPGQAVSLAERTLEVEDVEVEERMKLITCLGRSAANIGQAQRAQAAVAEVDRLLAANPMPPEFRLRALSNSGATLHTLGKMQAALDYYGRAYQAARQSESEIAQVAMLGNVGAIHSEGLGAYAQAEDYFARADEIARRSGEMAPPLPYNRGMNYRRMGRTADALAAFAEAERLAAGLGNDLVLQRARAERLALEALERGLPAEAGAALLDIARRQRELADPSGAAATLVRLSEGALQAGDAGQALAHARAARALVPEGVFPFERRSALDAELDALEALGDWRAALQVSEELRAAETSSLHSNLDGLAALQAKLQDTRSAEELMRLREERQIKALEMAHAARLRNAWIIAFISLAVLAAAFAWYQRGVTARLRRLSTVDGMTGLLNRRAASRQLQRSGQAPADGDRRGVVFLIDIDHFKARNDRYGHAAGDSVLKAVARQLRACSRPGDVVARWGGEEFLVGCQALDLAAARLVAERLRAAMGALALDEGEAGRDHPLSASIGFACHPFFPQARDGDWEDAVSLADRALYAAKHSGRDAWVGLWGVDGSHGGMAEVLADPDALAARGAIDIAASRLPVRWQARPETPAPG